MYKSFSELLEPPQRATASIFIAHGEGPHLPFGGSRFADLDSLPPSRLALEELELTALLIASPLSPLTKPSPDTPESPCHRTCPRAVKPRRPWESRCAADRSSTRGEAHPLFLPGSQANTPSVDWRVPLGRQRLYANLSVCAMRLRVPSVRSSWSNCGLKRAHCVRHTAIGENAGAGSHRASLLFASDPAQLRSRWAVRRAVTPIREHSPSMFCWASL